MKRQPKPFVVEIKRSSRKNPTPAATPIWDVAALLSSVESDAQAKPSQAAASAFFRSPEPPHAPSAHQAERRILPVIAPEPQLVGPQEVEPEMVEPEMVEKEPLRAEAATRDETVSSMFSTAKSSYDEPEVQYLEFDTVEPPAAPVKRPSAPRRETENVLSFAAETASAPIRRNRPDRDLPRGERWKRRLPKIMR